VSTPAIVFVHGLWLTGAESWWLRHRLCAQGEYAWQTFHYGAAYTGMAEIAESLREQIDGIDAPAVHLIGHSLGGIVIMRMLELQAGFPAGRVVFLGTPAQPSHAARTVRSHLYGRLLLGSAAAELADAPPRHWHSERELGLVAGTRPMGLAQLVVHFDEPNDGVVAAAETVLPGATARIELPVSHFGMLMSAPVAHQIGNFLRLGCFDAG
jgi:pimeloyl-ACP methyl ester carboxylesterase